MRDYHIASDPTTHNMLLSTHLVARMSESSRTWNLKSTWSMFLCFFSFLPFAMATTATYIYISSSYHWFVNFCFQGEWQKKKWFASRLEKKRKKKKTNRPITIVICLFNIALAHTLTSSLRLVICNGNKRQKMSLTTFFGDHLFWHLCCWSTISRNESELALNMLFPRFQYKYFCSEEKNVKLNTPYWAPTNTSLGTQSNFITCHCRL